MRISRHALLSATTLIALVALLARPIADAPAPRQVAADMALRTASVPFVENAGQSPAHVRFSANTFAGSVHVTGAGELVYALPSTDGIALLRESSAEPQDRTVAGIDASPTRVNYFLGDDASRWIRGAPTWDGVRIDDVADGVALEVRARGRNVEKLFHVSPGADVASVRMRFDGADALSVGDGGALDVSTPRGTLVFTKPVAYQMGETGRNEVACAYAVEGDSYGFRVGAYDPARPLVIDPLIASTYFGGTDPDRPYAIALHGDSVYIAGTSSSFDFPTTAGAYVETLQHPLGNGFVARFTPDLTTLLACTFVGGSGTNDIYELLVSDTGVFVAGSTDTANFPTTPGAFQDTFGGGDDAFVCRLSADLSTLEASTFLGGTHSEDSPLGLAETPQGLYLGGETHSANFPLPAVPSYQTQYGGAGDAFVVRFDTDLTALSAGTLFGGTLNEEPNRLRVHGGDVWIVGTTNSLDMPTRSPAPGGPFQPANAANNNDAFVARFDADLANLVAATYLGGGGMSVRDDYGIELGFQSGDVFVFGTAQSSSFPTTPGAFDETIDPASSKAFVSRLNTDLSMLRASTLFGGSGYQFGQTMAVDDRGVFIIGFTDSADLPIGPMADYDTLNGGGDMFVAALSLDLTTLLDSTYLGGSHRNQEWAYDMEPSGDGFYITGTTTSDDFPTTPGAYDTTYNQPAFAHTDVFVTHLELTLSSGPPDPGDGVIDSFFLPKKLVVKPRADKPAKSKLIAIGWFDTGSEAPDFGQPAALTVGGSTFQVPRLAQKGKWYRYKEGGVDFRVKPSRFGSSKALFKLLVRGAAALAVDPDQPVLIRYESGSVDAIGEVQLTKGRYKLGRVRGTLLQPALALYICKTGVKGDDRDAIRLRLGLATGEGTPATAPPLTVTLGSSFTEIVPADAFERRGEKYVFRGAPGGIGKAVLDYAKEKLDVVGQKVEVGEFPEGAQPVLITLTLGAEELAVMVRMVRTGKKLRY